MALSEDALQQLISEGRQTVQSLPEGRKQTLTDNLEGFNKELDKTGVTRLLLWQEYILQHPQGYSYTQFCYHLSQFKTIQQASMHFTHRPGECMMVDFGS